MKKAKDREVSTIGQNKAFQEKLDLMKKKSPFIEDRIKYLEIERDKSNFILRCFKQALMFFPINTAKSDFPEELREWPKLSSLKEAAQPKSQEELEKLCESFEQAIKDGDFAEDEYVIIDFEKDHLIWNGISYYFADVAIELAPSSYDSLKSPHQSLYRDENSHWKGTVYLWDHWKEDSIHGLLKVVDDEGKIYFFELEHFSMMTLALTCSENARFAKPVCEAEDKASEATVAEEGTKSREVPAQEECVKSISLPSLGIFILMDRTWQALFTAFL